MSKYRTKSLGGDLLVMKGLNDCLTKREYFAGLALQGLAAYPSKLEQFGNPKAMAETAVSWADALLAELNKEPSTASTQSTICDSRRAAIVAYAKGHYEIEGELEFHDDAPVSEQREENGAYVQASYWVPFHGTEFDKERDGEGWREG